MGAIAEQFYGDVGAARFLAQVNKINDSDLIYPGQLIELPWIVGNESTNYRQLLFYDGGVRETPDLFIAVVVVGSGAYKGIKYLVDPGATAGIGLIERAKESIHSGYQTARRWFGLNDKVPQFSTIAAERMENPNRYVPVQILQDVVRTTQGIPDPRGSDALMHYTTIFKNGGMYNFEILNHHATNKIYHFLYSREEMGHLPRIVK